MTSRNQREGYYVGKYHGQYVRSGYMRFNRHSIPSIAAIRYMIYYKQYSD